MKGNLKIKKEIDMKKNGTSKSFVNRSKKAKEPIVNGFSKKFNARRNRLIQFVEDATGKKNPLVDKFNNNNKEEE